jgi:TPP-dependent pyruvate/acetoin dehydrogenase alpha subunit
VLEYWSIGYSKPITPVLRYSSTPILLGDTLMAQRKKTKSSAAKTAIAPDERWLHFHRQMLKIRLFEEEVNQLYLGAKMPGLAHLYIGEEAVAVGVCEALRRDDYITSTHRGHGHCIAKGAKADRMFAELLGKEAGYCRGKGGSMHIADQDTGNLGANAIVGGSAGIATGAALSAKMRGTDQVAACFFGDGALGQGLLYESMNMAALWKLPVIYICENNQYNEYTHYSETTAGELTARAQAFGIATESVDGQDIKAVHAVALNAVGRARRGAGPSFLLCNTYRFHGHHVGDIDRAYYRAKTEEEEWKTDRDPIVLLAEWLKKNRLADAETLRAVENEISTEMKSAVTFALETKYPEPDEVNQHVYA